VLIARAGPTDFPTVPPAGPIDEGIRALRQDLYGTGNLQIDILSTEAGVQSPGPPRKESLRDQLSEGYDVLVFLSVTAKFKKFPGYLFRPASSNLKTCNV